MPATNKSEEEEKMLLGTGRYEAGPPPNQTLNDGKNKTHRFVKY